MLVLAGPWPWRCILTRPETATMPGLTGETFNAARLATARAGFTQTPVQQTRPARRRSRSARSCEQQAGARHRGET